MSQHGTFNVGRINLTLRQHRAAFHVAIWCCICLAAMDFAINIIFAYPQNPTIRASRLNAYFEYGRSTEGQLRRMTRSNRALTAPITLAGWYAPLQIHEFASKKANNPIVTIYGQSHSVNLANALDRVSDRFTSRSVGAPGATSNWAYGAYLRDRGGFKSHAVVLTFQSSSLAMITTLSPITWAIDAPMPYTADRFVIEGQQLRVIHPPYESFDSYIAALSDLKKWSVARDFFAKNDPLYDPLIFRETIFDHSSLFRLAHRAYGAHVIRNVRQATLDQSGFRPQSEGIKVAKAIIHQFAAQARSDGSIPIIFLVNDLGYSNYLLQALSPVLRADKIPYLSSDSIVSPSDPHGYLSDSHFTTEVDNKLARALDKLIAEGDIVPTLSHNQAKAVN